MPMRSPARSRLALRSRPSARGGRSGRARAGASISTALRLVLLVVVGQVGVAGFGRSAVQADLVGVLLVQGQIGLFGGLGFGPGRLIIDVVCVVDRGFSG